MKLHPVEGLVPGIAARIAGAERGEARRFAFRVARLACAVAGVHDRNALEVARGGLEHYPETEDLVALWTSSATSTPPARPTSAPTRARATSTRCACTTSASRPGRSAR